MCNKNVIKPLAKINVSPASWKCQFYYTQEEIRNQKIKDPFEKREKYPTQNLNTFFWRIDVFSSVHITTLCRPSLSLSECYLFALYPFTYNYLSQMWKQPEDPWVHHWLSEYILHTTSKHLSISYILYTPVSDLYSKHSNAQGSYNLSVCLFYSILLCLLGFAYLAGKFWLFILTR